MKRRVNLKLEAATIAALERIATDLGLVTERGERRPCLSAAVAALVERYENSTHKTVDSD